jgi:hypothetical protein
MLTMMLTAFAKLPASVGWKYPSQSPFQGRVMAPLLAVQNKPVAPPTLQPAIELKRSRKLAWLQGGEERVGFRILGRRIEPMCDALRTPRVK